MQDHSSCAILPDLSSSPLKSISEALWEVDFRWTGNRRLSGRGSERGNVHCRRNRADKHSLSSSKMGIEIAGLPRNLEQTALPGSNPN